MKIYLAGPMTGYPEMNHPLFHAETARLRALGHKVTNPAEEAPDQSMEWVDAMLVDIPALMACDAIALLPGWEASKGARIEHCIACASGMLVSMASDLRVSVLSTSERIATLFEAIKHGDSAHQDWLKQAIDAHFAGRPVPRVVLSAASLYDAQLQEGRTTSA